MAGLVWISLKKTIEKILFSDRIIQNDSLEWARWEYLKWRNSPKVPQLIAKAIAAATAKGAYSLIGGGDSVAAINKNGLADKVSYVFPQVAEQCLNIWKGRNSRASRP